MKDYRKLVPTTPPEGLVAAASQYLHTAGLVYNMEWVQDESIEAMLEKPGRKKKAVRCTCSECRKSAILEYAPPNKGDFKECYGFHLQYDGDHEVIRHGDSALCPICGASVEVRLASKVGCGEFAANETNILSASLLDGEHGERPLVLTGWDVRRLVDRYANERYEVRPLEAYIFEKETAAKLIRWVKSYSGHSGYFMVVCKEWRQPPDWSEDWGRVREIYGLTHELVADSCLGNSKLDVYMRTTELNKLKSPIVYLRLYQKYPQIENLVVQECSYLLDRLFEEKMNLSEWEKNRKGLMTLPEICFEEKRPAQMLGLTKEEFRQMQEQCWDTYHWQVYVKAKAVGDRMKIPDDITLLHQYGGEDIEDIIGRAPVGKTLRYLFKMMQEWSAANDPYNEYGDYMPCEDLLDASYLTDYWNMAEEAGWNLTDPAIRWPQDLFAAHERARAARTVLVTKKLSKLFKKRAKELAKFAYTSGPLMIRPVASQRELNREGELLDHCVAGYGEDIALGKTAIFLIRHTWEPEKPYFTLQYNEKKESVSQNRGEGNCSRTSEVEAFEKEWIAWIRRGCKLNNDGTPKGAKPPLNENPEMNKNSDFVA